MNGYSNTSTSLSSDPVFAPVTNSIANAINQIPHTIQAIVNATVRNDLNNLRNIVGVENPELASTITASFEGGRLTYSMEGEDASNVEYGNQEFAPRAFLRKTAERTAQTLQQQIAKVTRL
jgi:hypothetical protein